MFAACFTGSLMQEKSIEEAVEIASEFVCRSIRETIENPAHWYGVKFESALPWLINKLF
jgi:pyridoxine kinase